MIDGQKRSLSSSVPGGLAPTNRQTALVVISQAVLMGSGAVVALFIARWFGKSSETDAFFTAYGLYAVGLAFSGTFRLTAVAPLVRAGGPGVATRLLLATVFLTIACAVPMVLFASPVASLLSATSATEVATTSMRILWVGAAGQLVGAMLSTILAVRGSFTAIGIITLVAGIITASTFGLTRDFLGIQAAAAGLAAGGLWVSSASAVVLFREGWRPSRLRRTMVFEAFQSTLQLFQRSLTFIGANSAYLISLAIVAHLGEGKATLYSYSYVLAAFLVALTANVVAMIRSPSLVASSQRSVEIEESGKWSLRMTIVIGAPLFGLLALVGSPLLKRGLGSAFTTADVRLIIFMFICFFGWALASASGIFAVVELLARNEVGFLGLLATSQVVAVALVGFLAGVFAGAAGVAFALSLVAAAISLIQLYGAFGESSTSVIRRLGSDLGREAVLIVAAFGPSVLVISRIGYLASSALAITLATVFSLKIWPTETRPIIELIYRRPSR